MIDRLKIYTELLNIIDYNIHVNESKKLGTSSLKYLKNFTEDLINTEIKNMEDTLQLEGLNQIAKTINNNNRAKGFWDGETVIGEKLMLIVTEVAEAMEAWRKGREVKEEHLQDVNYRADYSPEGNFKAHIKDTFEDEIADTMIRLFDLCGALGIDIESHIYHKVEYNKTRERLHGKKC